MEQQEIFNRIVEKRALEFSDVKDKIDPNNLVYEFKTGGNNPKEFRNYWAPLKLFNDLRDGNVNPKDILKNQVRFKSDLSDITIDGEKSEDQKNVTKNFLEIMLFYYLKLNTKQTMGRDLKY